MVGVVGGGGGGGSGKASLSVASMEAAHALTTADKSVYSRKPVCSSCTDSF